MRGSEFDAERGELLSLLASAGVLRSTPSQPIRWPDGSPARWMLDSLRVLLTSRGAELAGRCLLHLLGRFESPQIATFGTTAIPLLQSCVLLSGGRYRGLIIRREPKRGAGRIVEGDFDPSQPVVIIDDSVSSGSAMFESITRLSAVGLRVEGGVCLVRFGWLGGVSRLEERGLHMEALFDAARDLSPLVDGLTALLPANPSKTFGQPEWAHERAPEGLHPATLSRLVIEHVLDGKPVPRPPLTLDRNYDGAGGTWVSVRPRSNILQRFARHGFWHLPGEHHAPLPEEIALVAAGTASRLKALPEARQLLARSAIAVTFFGALEACTVGQLDNDRYGVLICSRERPGFWGGALPRMPGMSREWAQFAHARKNGQLLPHEPFALYRHTLTKATEPGAVWQPTGVPIEESDAQGTPRWYDDPALGGRVAQRAYDLLCAQLSGEPERTAALPDDLLPELHTLFVTIHIGGKIAGCMGGRVSKLDEDLRRAAVQALADRRFEPKPTAATLGSLAVSVSLLHAPMELGAQTPAEIAVRVRLGEQVLVVFQGSRHGLLLPFAALQLSLSREQYVAEVIDKAGITRPPYAWGTYECRTWLTTGEATQRMPFGLPEPSAATSPEELVRTLTPLHASYLLRHDRSDGLRVGYYRPLLDQSLDELEVARQAHGTWVMAHAARVLGDARLADAARRGIDTLASRAAPDPRGDWGLAGPNQSIAEVSFLLLALCELERPETQQLACWLAESLSRRIDTWGRIATHAIALDPSVPIDEKVAASQEVQQDYLPAQALLALAAASSSGKVQLDPVVVRRAVGYYRHRFRYQRSWGQVAWLTQAAAAWWRCLRGTAASEGLAELVFEIVDWALLYQQEKSGGFINDQQPDSPGYTTGVYLEGVVAGLLVAGELGDSGRVRRYREAALAAVRFLDSITYQERDRPLLPNPAQAIGGVRISRTASDVRIDFVQHALSALIELQRALAKPE